MRRLAVAVLVTLAVALSAGACSSTTSPADLAGKYRPVINKIEKVTNQVRAAVPVLVLSGAQTPEQGDKILETCDRVQRGVDVTREALDDYERIADLPSAQRLVAAIEALQRLFLELTAKTLVASPPETSSYKPAIERRSYVLALSREYRHPHPGLRT